jgi:hypothetical protein
VREKALADTTWATRVEDANRSTETRKPAEGLKVTFNVPSSGVATVNVRVFLTVSAARCVVVVFRTQGETTSWSAAASEAAVG